jgi:nucleoside-diphosphate-sugar epimerase
MKIDDTRILVTGGAGIIGKELINRLIKKNENVFCIDREPKPSQINKLHNYIQCDLNNMQEDEIIDINPDLIFHLAATFERTEETPDFWEKNFKDNIAQTQFVLNSAKKCKNLKRFIFTSSYLIYDEGLYLFREPQKRPIKLSESSKIDTRNLTGASKYYTEQSLKYLERYGDVDFNSLSVRIFRVYGKYSNDFLSRTIRMALKGEKVTLYNKEGLFDYIYAGDVAEGLVRLAETKETGIVNLGSGNSYSVEKALNLIIEEIPALRTNKVKSDLLYEASCADITKLKKITGWEPKVGLKEGLIKIILNEKR